LAQLRQSDFHRLLEFLRDCETFGDLDGLREGMLPGLRKLIPCDSVAHNEVDPVTGDFRFLVDPPDIASRVDPEAFRR
jgi:hypothetical protein